MDNRTTANECTYFKLQSLHRVVARYYDSHLADSGLKGTQLALLSSIWSTEPVRPSDLALRLHLDNSTITRTLRTLRERGLTRCLPGSDDRSRFIELTDDGQKALARGRRSLRHAQTELADQVSVDELDRLHALLDRFTDTLNAHA